MSEYKFFYGQTAGQEVYAGQCTIAITPDLNGLDSGGRYMCMTGYCTQEQADLMCAAPELLEALEVLVFASESETGEPYDWDAARAAIAKAKGNQ